jgi:hypothetical protein
MDSHVHVCSLTVSGKPQDQLETELGLDPKDPHASDDMMIVGCVT